MVRRSIHNPSTPSHLSLSKPLPSLPHAVSPPRRHVGPNQRRNPNPEITGESEVVACPCGSENTMHCGLELFMLDCDRCHRWFHGLCVGICESGEARAVCSSLDG